MKKIVIENFITSDLLKVVFQEKGVKMAIDPVCKMEVNEKTARIKSTYQGKTYYFCAPACKKAFEEDPDKYLEGSKQKEK